MVRTMSHLDAANGQILFWPGIQGSNLMIYVTESLHVSAHPQNIHQRFYRYHYLKLLPTEPLIFSLPCPFTHPTQTWNLDVLFLILPLSRSPAKPLLLISHLVQFCWFGFLITSPPGLVPSSAAAPAQLLVLSFPIYCNNLSSNFSGTSSPIGWLTHKAFHDQPH